MALTDEEVDRIAERVAEKAIEQHVTTWLRCMSRELATRGIEA